MRKIHLHWGLVRGLMLSHHAFTNQAAALTELARWSTREGWNTVELPCGLQCHELAEDEPDPGIYLGGNGEVWVHRDDHTWWTVGVEYEMDWAGVKQHAPMRRLELAE